MILDIQALQFRYHGQPVLHDVCCHVRAGELLAILGPNGAGKTTLLKCINAIHTPADGTILVEGRDVLRLSAAEIAKRIGYVPQRAEAARLTVFDAVLLGRMPHFRWQAREEDLRMVDSALKRLDLAPLALRYLDTLSGGELQKVCVARALVQEPRLLLLDEPTSALDLRNQLEIMRLIRRVVDEHQVAAVMTMHDLNTALRFAHTVVFLKHGRVHACVPAEEVVPETIEAVYGVPVTVHRLGGVPVVTPAA
ncbi:ABC transporter ATP-binding protein [Megalodesulfovibrio paquesii]